MERVDLLYAARSDDLLITRGPGPSHWFYCTLNVTQFGTAYQVNAAIEKSYLYKPVWHLKTTHLTQTAAVEKFFWIRENLTLALAEGSGPKELYFILNCKAGDAFARKACEDLGRKFAADPFSTWPLIDTSRGKEELTQGLATLGVGCYLLSLLESGQALSPESAAGLARFFSAAPLKGGYWGPYKRLIKLLETRPDDAQWLGIALSRLDAHCLITKNYRDLEPYGVPIPQAVPSLKTINYMVRRGRRHLRHLARTQPDVYVRCVLGVFQQPAHEDIARRWILADILYGRGTKDFHRNRWSAVQLPAIPARYDRRWDRSPEIWDNHLDMVRRCWVENSSQADIQVWAFWVLMDHPQPLPELPINALALALVSPASHLQHYACQQISTRPDALLELNKKAVYAFLTASAAYQLHAVLPFLSANSGCMTLQQALLLYVRQVALPAIRSNTFTLSPAFRATRLLAFALKHYQAHLGADDIPPLALYLGHMTGFEPIEQWRWILQVLPLATLLSLRLQLPALSAEVADPFDAACRLAAKSTPPPEDLVLGLVRAPQASMRDLGWDLLPYLQPAVDLGAVWEQLLAQGCETGNQPLLLESVRKPARLHQLLALPVSPALLVGIVAAIADADAMASRLILDKLRVSGDTPMLLQAMEAHLAAQSDPTGDEALTLLHQALAVDPQVPALIWAARGRDAWSSLARGLMIHPALANALVRAIDPEDLPRATPLQIEMLAQALRSAPERLGDDPRFAVAAGTCPHPPLHQPVLAWLETQGLLGKLYLPLAESGLPAALAAAERYLLTLDGPLLTRAVLQVCDSGVGPARALGLRLLAARGTACDLPAVLTALAEHTAPEITALVARHALDGAPVRRDALARFDDRVLRTRHSGRAAKNLVKARLDQTLAPDPSKVAALVPPDEQRLATLLGLARGGNHRDREWALQQLARLSLAGHSLAGLQVSITS